AAIRGQGTSCWPSRSTRKPENADDWRRSSENTSSGRLCDGGSRAAACPGGGHRGRGGRAAAARRAARAVSAGAGAASAGSVREREAAACAGTSVHALHAAMAARAVHFEQDCRGGKAWFKRTDIDAWRRGERTSTLGRAA